MKKISFIGIAVSCVFFISTFAQKPSHAKKIEPCNSRAIYLPEPNYPNADARVSGTVLVATIINKEGNVSSAKAVSGHPLLRQEAERAALKAKFKPTIIEGKTVESYCLTSYIFSLPETTILEKDKVQLQEQRKIHVLISPLIIGKAIKLPKPSVPGNFSGKLSEIEDVLVKIVIDKAGSVTFAKATTGHPFLRKLSEISARESKFSQSKLMGKSVKAKALLTYTFKILESREADVSVSNIKPEI